MSAAETVIDTYELLESILASLRPQDVPVADRVCKTWHTLVRCSKRIRRARCLKPIAFSNNFREGRTLDGELAPYYEHSGILTVSKLVFCAERSPNGDSISSPSSQNRWIIMFKFLDSATSLKVSERALHVTNPPVTAIELDVFFPMEGNLVKKVSCTVWNKRGVVIADLLDAVQALRVSEAKYAEIQRSTILADYSVFAGIRLGSSVRVSDAKRSWRGTSG